MDPRSDPSSNQATLSAAASENRAGIAVLPDGNWEEPLDHAALDALRREAPPPDALLANLMDEAMQAMLEHHAPPHHRPSPAPRELSPPANDLREPEDFGAVLTPDEAAALADQIRSEPPASFPDRPEFGGHVITAMPTDEELAALFAESQVQQDGISGSPAGGAVQPRARAPDVTAAARAVELELARDQRLSEELDPDAIQADLALEARASVNIAEPPVRDVEFLSANSGFGARLLEPEGAHRPVPWWLAPLVWLNAPLATPGVRDGAGKLAVLVLLNATAVLVYVFIIRR